MVTRQASTAQPIVDRHRERRIEVVGSPQGASGEMTPTLHAAWIRSEFPGAQPDSELVIGGCHGFECRGHNRREAYFTPGHPRRRVPSPSTVLRTLAALLQELADLVDADQRADAAGIRR